MTQLVDKADRKTAWEFLQHMLEAVPYQVHTILTDNGIQFAEQPGTATPRLSSRPMRFDMICEANGIEHRLTKPNHPWTNGRVELNEPHDQGRDRQTLPLRRSRPAPHPTCQTLMAAYNFARRLKTLGGLTPRMNTSARSGHPSQTDSS